MPATRPSGPGYHADKHHWKTVDFAGDVPATELQEMVEHSYDLVLLGLPRAQRDRQYRD